MLRGVFRVDSTGRRLGDRLRRLFDSLLLSALGLVLFAAEPVAAQSCFSMQVEMMRLQSGGFGASSERDRYERAYREQSNVLARTEMRARQAGCFGSGFFLFRREPDRSCNTLIPKLRDMQENLARLDHLRRRRGGDNSYRINELKGMMQARGCDLPGGSVFEARPDDNNGFFRESPLYSSGTYRTLCVRTCDGYYFPISFSTTSDRFPEDAQTCAAMCPGAQAELFYHPNPGGGPETMMSMGGVPYSSLPTAFQYRTSLNASCTCKPAEGYSVAAAQSAPAPGVSIDRAAPLPRPRPAPGEDPETLADRAGYFVPPAKSDEPDAAGPLAADETGRQIRVVGPAIGNAAQDALVIAPVPN